MIFRSKMVWILMVMLAFSLSCTTLMPSQTPLPPAETLPEVPSPTPGVLESEVGKTPTPAAVEYTLTVENASPYPICEVYITPAEATGWGENWLMAGASLASGARQDFALEAERVNLKLLTCDGAVLGVYRDMATDTVVTAGAADLESLRVTNSLGVPICSVYIAGVEVPDWGEDWLPEGERLETGSSYLVFLPWGLYTAMVEDCEGNILAQVTLPLQRGGLTWEVGAQYSPGDSWIYVYNQSSYEICGVYFGPPESEFGPNLVGRQELVQFSDAVWGVEVGLEHPWVVVIEDCHGLRLDYNPVVYPGDWVVIGGEGLAPLEVYNYTTAVVCELYISPVTEDTWGENWLKESEVINPEDGERVFFVEPGSYDLLAVDCDGQTVAKYEGGTISSEGAYWELNP